jgi:BirA family biotin operon repressor/biotin-[acetyl-CoA-carboxylase] ligase
MKPGDDLTAEALEPILDGRALRASAVVLSTASSAIEWAGTGAPDGAVVVADTQISPRGHAGRPWKVTSGRDLGFALVLRPQLPADREGWLYTVVMTALADVLGEGVTIQWPDEVHRGDATVAAAGLEIRLGARGVKWAVVNVLLVEPERPRGELLAAVVAAIEARLAAPPEEVLADYNRICSTFGRHVRIRLLGGTRRFEGTALSTQEEGALVIESAEGRELPVRPQDVSSIVAA